MKNQITSVSIIRQILDNGHLFAKSKDGKAIIPVRDSETAIKVKIVDDLPTAIGAEIKLGKESIKGIADSLEVTQEGYLDVENTISNGFWEYAEYYRNNREQEIDNILTKNSDENELGLEGMKVVRDIVNAFELFYATSEEEKEKIKDRIKLEDKWIEKGYKDEQPQAVVIIPVNTEEKLNNKVNNNQDNFSHLFGGKKSPKEISEYEEVVQREKELRYKDSGMRQGFPYIINSPAVIKACQILLFKSASKNANGELSPNTIKTIEDLKSAMTENKEFGECVKSLLRGEEPVISYYQKWNSTDNHPIFYKDSTNNAIEEECERLRNTFFNTKLKAKSTSNIVRSRF